MKNLNPIKTFKFLLDFIWYTFIVSGTIWLLVNIYCIAFDGVVNGSSFLTFEVQTNALSPTLPKLSNIFDFSISNPPKMELELNSFKVNQFGTPFIMLYILSLLIVSCISMYQLKLLRGFLKNILAQQIFTKENVALLTNIAIVELVTIPLSVIYYVLMTILFRNSQIVNANLEFAPNYVDCFESIIQTLEYFLFASVFAFGFKLKQESDLTI